MDLSRGVFDKETRRKPLAFAADAYGISMPLLHAEVEGNMADWPASVRGVSILLVSQSTSVLAFSCLICD